MIGDFTGRGIEDRVAGSVAAALLAVQNRASLVRVHDVKETIDAINVWLALR
jgi:dihydropteroate synthase